MSSPSGRYDHRTYNNAFTDREKEEGVASSFSTEDLSAVSNAIRLSETLDSDAPVDDLSLKTYQPSILAKDGTLYCPPYLDPSRHISLESFLNAYRRKTTAYYKGNDPSHRSRNDSSFPLETVLIVAKPPVALDTHKPAPVRHVLLTYTKSMQTSPVIPSDRQRETRKGKASKDGYVCFPNGVLRQREEVLDAARRIFNEQFGMTLSWPAIVGAVMPSQRETKELSRPYINYVVTGNATPPLVHDDPLPDEPNDPRCKRNQTKTFPCYVRPKVLNAIFATTPLPAIASLVFYQHAQFVLEVESYSGPYTIRTVLYRNYGEETKLLPLARGEYPY